MTEYANFEDISPAIEGDGGEDFTLPSGKVVRLRGQSRYELVLSGKGTEDAGVIEARNLRNGIVAPKLTAGQVDALYRNPKAAPDVYAMLQKIRELSGLTEGADKSDQGSAGDD